MMCSIYLKRSYRRFPPPRFLAVDWVKRRFRWEWTFILNGNGRNETHQVTWYFVGGHRKATSMGAIWLDAPLILGTVKRSWLGTPSVVVSDHAFWIHGQGMMSLHRNTLFKVLLAIQFQRTLASQTLNWLFLCRDIIPWSCLYNAGMPESSLLGIVKILWRLGMPAMFSISESCVWKYAQGIKIFTGQCCPEIGHWHPQNLLQSATDVILLSRDALLWPMYARASRDNTPLSKLYFPI